MIRIFYTLKRLDAQTLNTLKENIKSIDVIAPQCCEITENGILQGSIDPELMLLAEAHNLKIMPLVINQQFSQDVMHKLLNNPEAQSQAIKNMVEFCKNNSCYGMQFDFECISIKDKNLYTNFYKAASEHLRKKGYCISIAIVPRFKDNFEHATNYERWVFENWSGAYDYQELGKLSNFVSLMCYDQHTRKITPGPIAGCRWIEALLDYAMKYIPREKISLGIPTYSDYWYPDLMKDKPYSGARSLGYQELLKLLEEKKISLIWDIDDKINYVVFKENYLNHYIFAENSESFKEKLRFIKEFNLHGFSVWRLGLEDPKIWNILTLAHTSIVSFSNRPAAGTQRAAAITNTQNTILATERVDPNKYVPR